MVATNDASNNSNSEEMKKRIREEPVAEGDENDTNQPLQAKRTRTPHEEMVKIGMSGNYNRVYNSSTGEFLGVDVDNGRRIPLISPSKKRVLGFTPAQRQAFLKHIMRFGRGDYKGMKGWEYFYSRLGPELRNVKTLPEISAYGDVFLEHICEEIPDGSNCYYDGVPIDKGVVATEIASRLNLMHLIYTKMRKYEEQQQEDAVKEEDGKQDHFDINEKNLTSLHSQWKSNPSWGKDGDKKLLFAILKHGYGRWSAIAQDPELGILQKLKQQPTLYDDTKGESADIKEGAVPVTVPSDSETSTTTATSISSTATSAPASTTSPSPNQRANNSSDCGQANAKEPTRERSLNIDRCCTFLKRRMKVLVTALTIEYRIEQGMPILDRPTSPSPPTTDEDQPETNDPRIIKLDDDDDDYVNRSTPPQQQQQGQGDATAPLRTNFTIMFFKMYQCMDKLRQLLGASKEPDETEKRNAFAELQDLIDQSKDEFAKLYEFYDKTYFQELDAESL